MLGVSASGPIGTEGALESRPVLVPGLPRDAPQAGARSVNKGASPVQSAERNAWAVLAAVDGLGPVGFSALLKRYGSGVAILDEAASPGGPSRLATTPAGDDIENTTRRSVNAAVAKSIADAAQRAGETLERMDALGLQIVTAADAGYPRRLAAIEMPPHVLFVLGDPLALEARSSVALVGTRRATDAGRALAARLASALVSAGCTIVSGLATGIDGAAHSATIHARGTTVAVIGSGHAALFPRIHKRLAASIVASGGAIVSELAPDVRPTHGTFPRRNRIISGLADATVVVEAPARSGALITASWALEQGRECFIVPGPIDAPASAGCLAFLREFAGSARIVAGIPQLIDDLGLADHQTQPGVSTNAAATLVEVGDAAGRIGRELVLGRATVDELVAVTGWPVASVLAALTMLERHGLAVGIHGRFRPAGSLAAADPATARRRSSAHT
ncbi:MAG: DNA-processing protein DprA [Candidatus Limnocylindrales bacterium]|nr:DNA-processing protein DprA [Candidatus Limnocylindrales bacterium]